LQLLFIPRRPIKSGVLRLKKLPQTKSITVFGKETLNHFKENHCLVLDLTKLAAPENDHLDTELARHNVTDKTRFKGFKEFVWSRSKLEDDMHKIVYLAGKAHVVIYGFHKSLPEIVKALTEAEVKHWIVLSNTQHESLGREKPTQLELEEFAKNLAEQVTETY